VAGMRAGGGYAGSAEGLFVDGLIAGLVAGRLGGLLTVGLSAGGLGFQGLLLVDFVSE